MSNRRNKTLDYLCLDIPGFNMTIVDRLYKSGHKGPAVRFQLNAIRDYWVLLHRQIAEKERPNNSRTIAEPDFDIPAISLN